MSGGEGGHGHDVAVVFYSLTGRFLGCLKEGADVHVKAKISVASSDDLGAAVVAVLSHLGDHNTRAATFLSFELFNEFFDVFHSWVVAEFFRIDAADRANFCFIATDNFFDGVGNFPNRGAAAGGFDSEFKHVAFAGFHAMGDGIECVLAGVVIAFGFEFLEALDLRETHGGVVDIEDLKGIFFFEAVFVEADDGLLAGVDPSLATGSGFFDT